MTSPYRLLGIILAVAGAVLAPIFYFAVEAVPLAAVAMSMIILGLTAILLANAQPYLSPEASQVLLKVGMQNTASLLEELGVRSKAIYLPSSLREGKPQALVPLLDDAVISNIKDKLPGRLIVRYGPQAQDMAIAITTPGSLNLDLLPNKPGPSAEEIESAINYLLVGVLDIARGVTVNLRDSRVEVEVSGAKMAFEEIWYYHCLGSPIASVAAAVASEALQKPVRVFQESQDKGHSRITLEVLS